MDQTINYYNQNAEDFSNSTLKVEFTSFQDKFLGLIPKGGTVLDFGCGAGRDTKYFIDKGFKVDATDGSMELCKMASAYAGIQVKCALFQDLDEVEKYDGIWACSSILHVAKNELADVFNKMIRALKDRGVIYTSFKYGDFEGLRNGRYFSDFTEKSFEEFLSGICQLTIEEYWVSPDVRPGRSSEKWLNLILRKI